MLVTESFCWWLFSMYQIDHQHLESVTNILNLSPTHFVSNIRRQHRCHRSKFDKLNDFSRFSYRFWKRTFKDSKNNRFSNFHGELIFLNFCDFEFFRFCPSALSSWKNMIGIWIFCMSEKLILEKPKFIITTEVILRFSGFVILIIISQIWLTSLYIECVDIKLFI